MKELDPYNIFNQMIIGSSFKMKTVLSGTWNLIWDETVVRLSRLYNWNTITCESLSSYWDGPGLNKLLTDKSGWFKLCTYFTYCRSLCPYETMTGSVTGTFTFISLPYRLRYEKCRQQRNMWFMYIYGVIQWHKCHSLFHIYMWYSLR